MQPRNSVSFYCGSWANMMAYSSSMHLTIFGQTILLVVIHASYQQSDLSSQYPLVRIKPRIYEHAESLPIYQPNRKFIPTYPMPDMSGPIFHQPITVLNYKPIVHSAIVLKNNLDTLPAVYRRLDASSTSDTPTPVEKFIEIVPTTEMISMTSIICLNSLSSIAFSFLPINSSRLRGFCGWKTTSLLCYMWTCVSVV